MEKSKVRGKNFGETEKTSESTGHRHGSMMFAEIRRWFLSSISYSRVIGEVYILKYQDLHELMWKQIEIEEINIESSQDIPDYQVSL